MHCCVLHVDVPTHTPHPHPHMNTTHTLNKEEPSKENAAVVVIHFILTFRELQYLTQRRQSLSQFLHLQLSSVFCNHSMIISWYLILWVIILIAQNTLLSDILFHLIQCCLTKKVFSGRSWTHFHSQQYQRNKISRNGTQIRKQRTATIKNFNFWRKR